MLSQGFDWGNDSLLGKSDAIANSLATPTRSRAISTFQASNAPAFVTMPQESFDYTSFTSERFLPVSENQLEIFRYLNSTHKQLENESKTFQSSLEKLGNPQHNSINIQRTGN
jgi:hypothetical protein